MIDLISVLLNLGMLFLNDFRKDLRYKHLGMKYEKAVVTISILFTWIRVFYWMRLWPSTAFFIDLLNTTFTSVNFQAFLGSSILLIGTAACMLWILNMGREQEMDEFGIGSDRIFPKSVDNEFLNAFFFAYITSQGEYGTDEFKGENVVLLWLIFFGVTFLI